MRRLLAIAIVAAFLAGPTHRLMCLVSCDDAEHAGQIAQTEDCHSESGSERSVSAGPDHCEADVTPVTFTAKRVETKATGFIDAIGDRPVLTTVDIQGTASALVAIVAGPPPRLPIPLRI